MRNTCNDVLCMRNCVTEIHTIASTAEMAGKLGASASFLFRFFLFLLLPSTLLLLSVLGLPLWAASDFFSSKGTAAVDVEDCGMTIILLVESGVSTTLLFEDFFLFDDSIF